MPAQLRILCNSQNLIRSALLAASSVAPAVNAVIPDRTTSRTGTGSVQLTGEYTGAEDATIDIEILDTTADVTRASTPILRGVGSGTLDNITATAFAAQDVTVTLKDAGIPIVSAALAIEGVDLVAVKIGADGNDVHLNVDASGLVFTATNYSLIAGLPLGAGGPNAPVSGSANDFGNASVGADGLIPADAPRIAFGDDTGAVYTAYKKFANGAWSYYFVPALLRAIPAGTVVKAVTGSRTVTLTDDSDSPPTVETYTGIVTVYDLLSQIRDSSAIVTVDGVVAKDRTPPGQASRELLLRTDAHAEPSSGSGSRYAQGFESAFAATDAGTKAVIARCYAVNGRDHPLAHLGSERWEVRDTLLGALSDAVTGEAYLGPDFGFLIPRRLPPGYGTAKGKYSVTAIEYASRSGGETAPPICIDLAPLGSDPVDQTITLTYRARPSGDCLCDSLPTPHWSGHCLGTVLDGGTGVSYQADTIARLVALRTWLAETMRDNSSLDTTGSGGYIGAQDAFLAASVGVQQVIGMTAGFAAALTGLTPGLSLKEVCDRFAAVAVEMDPLEGGSPSLRTSGFGAWDTAVTELQDDVAAFLTTSSGIMFSIPSDRYTTRLEQVRMTAGLPLGEADASILESGDGCWRDVGDAYWWEVVGSVGGGYAPAFSNVAYYSSRRASVKDRYFSTHEFGFGIKIKCDGDLKPGDKITLAIGDAAWPATYQVGDELTLPIVAARDAYLAGGQDGTTVQTWNVNGSLAGALPPYVLDTSAPTAYSSGGLGFQITPGAIGFALGDRFSFAIEGGHFKWRLNGGAWNVDSPPLDIPDGAALLYDGLSATFTPGAAPSFAAGDVFSYAIKQPRAPSNIQTPGIEAWQWMDDDQSIVCDLGSSQTFANLAIALHTIPEGATITVEGGTAPGVYTLAETLPWRAGAMVAELSPTWTARYLRVTLSDAPDATIGWLYAGNALTTELSADMTLSRAYRIARGDGGLYQGGRFLAKAVSGEIEWTEGALPESDVAALQAVIEYVKENDDEPLIVVPNITRPEDALLARIAADEVEFPDISLYGANAGAARRHSTRIPLTGVWR